MLRNSNVPWEAQRDGVICLLFYDLTSGKFMTLHQIADICEIYNSAQSLVKYSHSLSKEQERQPIGPEMIMLSDPLCIPVVTSV